MDRRFPCGSNAPSAGAGNLCARKSDCFTASSIDALIADRPSPFQGPVQQVRVVVKRHRDSQYAGRQGDMGQRFAKARVRGFQGPDLKDPTRVLACPKHFAAYGAVQGGMDYNTADISDTTLRQTHLPPFKAAFEAGALSTMASFNGPTVRQRFSTAW